MCVRVYGGILYGGTCMEVYRQLHGGVCVCKGTLYMDVRETFVGVNW